MQFPGEAERTVWDWSMTPIAFPGGPGRGDVVEFVVVFAVEITEHVRAREELERLDRITDEFLSLASHELRTPLVPLTGHAEMLMRLVEEGGDRLPRRAALHAAKIQNQVQRLDRLIADLLDVSRLESGRLSLDISRFDLREVVEGTAEEARLLDPARSIEVTVPDAPVELEADRERITQVLLNLLHNAILHAPGSRVLLRLSLERSEAQAAGARIEVQDFGPGIRPEDASQLFTRFHYAPRRRGASRSGLGLGLYIVKQIVSQHGGEVDVQTAVGQGSTFVVRLPLEPPEAERERD